MQEQLRRAAEILAASRSTVALTGAGISVDSGIPAFRGAQGLWEKFDPMEYASIDAFMRDPGRVWRMLRELEGVVLAAEPNPVHHSLAELESLGLLDLLITQNIDGLHQVAGSKAVVEFHGSGRRLVCLECGRGVRRGELSLQEDVPLCVCGGLIKPDIVFFGEPIPQRALMAGMASAQSCSAMLVVGTSAVVAPASSLPVLAQTAGATVIEINLEPTPLTGQVADISLMGGGAEVLPELVEMVKELKGEL
ncbi:MAG: NAD-dependent deacylase [Desulfarculaceae bacterium]|nr:NAD-dependent deacylase [Desulfarculaceae bacterium]MCF8074233.1 NAD-dependent deacylase [Desulfarculaceae bacterium]MCF8103008.1 NAD-dependent deacylase [Desulfarculaceae bacterium]MCF8117139.1 NAD-dependent deacylase [Desulfarculaceae bacterium]